MFFYFKLHSHQYLDVDFHLTLAREHALTLFHISLTRSWKQKQQTSQWNREKAIFALFSLYSAKTMKTTSIWSPFLWRNIVFYSPFSVRHCWWLGSLFVCAWIDDLFLSCVECRKWSGKRVEFLTKLFNWFVSNKKNIKSFDLNIYKQFNKWTVWLVIWQFLHSFLTVFAYIFCNWRPFSL